MYLCRQRTSNKYMHEKRWRQAGKHSTVFLCVFRLSLVLATHNPQQKYTKIYPFSYLSNNSWIRIRREREREKMIVPIVEHANRLEETVNRLGGWRLFMNITVDCVFSLILFRQHHEHLVLYNCTNTKTSSHAHIYRRLCIRSHSHAICTHVCWV